MDTEVSDLFAEELTARPKGRSPLPLEESERASGIEVGEAYFVEPEEGEEPDVVTLRIHYVRLLEENDRLLRALWEASPEEAAKISRRRERAGRSRE